MSSPARRGALALVAAVLAATGLAACQPAEPADEDETTARIGVVPFWVPTTWDPSRGFVTTIFMPTQAVHESLIAPTTTDYGYEPLLAEEFSLSDDRRTLSITLRQDVEFVDGVHLDAAVAEQSLEAVLSGETYFKGVIGDPYDLEVTVTGEYSLELTTTKGIGMPFLDALSLLPIASPEALADPDGVSAAPVGSGPYVIDEQVPEVSISYVRNPEYRDPEAFDFDRLEFTIFDEPIAALNALKSGQIDLTEVTPQLAGEAEASGLSIATGGGSMTILAWVDHRDGTLQPALADRRVRQAISMALDRETAIEVLGQGYAEASSQVFREGAPEHVEDGDDRYPYDLAAARELLADAGYADGFDLVLPAYSYVDGVLPFVTQSLADLGIRVTTERYQDVFSYNEAVGKYAMAVTGVGSATAISYLDDPGFLNPPDGSVDPQIADILDRLNNGSREESAEASQELGEFLLEEQWYIPIYRALAIWASDPDFALEVGVNENFPPVLGNLSRPE